MFYTLQAPLVAKLLEYKLLFFNLCYLDIFLGFWTVVIFFKP